MSEKVVSLDGSLYAVESKKYGGAVRVTRIANSSGPAEVIWSRADHGPVPSALAQQAIDKAGMRVNHSKSVRDNPEALAVAVANAPKTKLIGARPGMAVIPPAESVRKAFTFNFNPDAPEAIRTAQGRVTESHTTCNPATVPQDGALYEIVQKPIGQYASISTDGKVSIVTHESPKPVDTHETPNTGAVRTPSPKPILRNPRFVDTTGVARPAPAPAPSPRRAHVDTLQSRPHKTKASRLEVGDRLQNGKRVSRTLRIAIEETPGLMNKLQCKEATCVWLDDARDPVLFTDNVFFYVTKEAA